MAPRSYAILQTEFSVTLSRVKAPSRAGPSRLPDRLPDDQPCIDKQTKPKKGGTQVPLVLKCSVASCPLRRVKPNLAVGNPLTKLPLNPDPARVTLPSLKSSVLDRRSDVHQEHTTELQNNLLTLPGIAVPQTLGRLLRRIHREIRALPNFNTSQLAELRKELRLNREKLLPDPTTPKLKESLTDQIHRSHRRVQ